MKHILITGGAGYIGSLLTSELLRLNYRVTVLDSLLFSGDALLPFLRHPNFHFVRTDVTNPRAVKDAVRDGWQKPNSVVHLAGIVGFPACQAVGKQIAWKNNVEATKMVFSQAIDDLGAQRFIFTSTCNVYGPFSDSKPRTETSPLKPQSLYAETKVAAESFLLEQKDSSCVPLVFRLATLYGVSPRTRFDLLINELVFDAHTKHKLLIYERGNWRSFIHVHDTVDAIILGLEAEQSKIRGEVYNLGTQNFKKYNDDPQNVQKVGVEKDNIAELIQGIYGNVELDQREDITFGGDLHDIRLSFDKIQSSLEFKGKYKVEDGIKELKRALDDKMIYLPDEETKYRNARPFKPQ